MSCELTKCEFYRACEGAQMLAPAIYGEGTVRCAAKIEAESINMDTLEYASKDCEGPVDGTCSSRELVRAICEEAYVEPPDVLIYKNEQARKSTVGFHTPAGAKRYEQVK